MPSAADRHPPRSSLPALRPWALLFAVLAWLGLGSVLTPWAEDALPRIWLYDFLFYVSFVLLTWALAEALLLALHLRQPSARRALPPLVAVAIAVAIAWAGGQTQSGLQLRIALSRNALEASADAGYNDNRHRAGLFLIDTTRQPCPGQTWLWLGRPHGAGTGTNLALVRSGVGAWIRTPSADAFGFLPLTDDWWMAYQHAARYRDLASLQISSADVVCMPGRVFSDHRDGLAFIAQGRR